MLQHYSTFCWNSESHSCRLMYKPWHSVSFCTFKYLSCFFLCRYRIVIKENLGFLVGENPGVCPEVVAQDILGLLRQDLTGRHYGLLEAVLDLLHCILKCSPADELSGCNIPVTMLPVFFNMQVKLPFPLKLFFFFEI